jgi:hypothetical protein
MTTGFWMLLDDMSPTLPDGSRLAWKSDVTAIVAALQGANFPAHPGVVELELNAVSSDGTTAGSFPWQVAKVGPNTFSFTPRESAASKP